jgi:hypothetical protein
VQSLKGRAVIFPSVPSGQAPHGKSSRSPGASTSTSQPSRKPPQEQPGPGSESNLSNTDGCMHCLSSPLSRRRLGTKDILLACSRIRFLDEGRGIELNARPAALQVVRILVRSVNHSSASFLFFSFLFFSFLFSRLLYRYSTVRGVIDKGANQHSKQA